MIRHVDTPSSLVAAAARLASAQVVALDTEFHTERRYRPELMLLQLRADDDEPVLVDPRPKGPGTLPLGALAAALSTVPVLVHGGQTDAVLVRDAIGVAPNIVFDTQIAAACVGQPYPARLQDLVARYLAFDMDKTWTLSDWSRRPISALQARYAADDVVVLGRLRASIEAELDRRGTRPVAQAATEEMLAGALAEETDDDSWRSVNGAHVLDGEEAAALQELAAWRQGEARARDIPRHSVLSDGMLLDLARRRPVDDETLRANRRLPSSVVKREGAALLAAVRRAAGRTITPLRPWPRAWGDLVRAAGRVR